MAFKKISIPTAGASISPLDITCTSTSCSDNLHCFKSTKKLVKEGRKGQCRDCGTKIVNWERLHKRDLSDLNYTFEMLNHELIRNVYWLTDLNEKVINYGLRKGRINLRETAKRELLKKVGNAENYREGIQTPKKGNNIIHYAQHATASCCRKCMEYWHGIRMGTPLDEKGLEYCTELIQVYIEERMEGKNLMDKPQKIPYKRK